MRHSHSLLVVLLLFYWGVSLHNLTIVPRMYEDEPWQASTGWKIATEGVFGADMFTGYHGMERRYYGYLPAHPLLLAAIFRVMGLGLFQARFEPVVLGLLVLVLTYTLAQRVFKDERIGLLAVLFLLLVRTTALTPSQTSGILLIDIARIARYDMLVPVLGLAALHAYISASYASGHRAAWLMLAGVLAGLSALSHLYGVFWLVVLLLLVVLEGSGRWSAVSCLILGFALMWLPYLAYVLGDLDAWRGQTAGYADRFELLDPEWYVQNVAQERLRYAPGLGALDVDWILRLGFWGMLIGVPLSIFALVRRTFNSDRSAQVIVVPAIVLPLMFALLIHLKLMNYAITIIPLWSIAVGWGFVTLWTRVRDMRTVRYALVALLALVLLEGMSRIVALESAGLSMTPYDTYIDQIRESIPDGARVLGLHDYWFGLDDYDYRSFAVPILWSDPRTESQPLSLAQGLDRIAPDVVLVDQRIREYLARDAQAGERFEAWLIENDARLRDRVEDMTYGLMEIYQVRR